MSTLVVFEDAASRALSTLTSLRAVFDLRCGTRTLLQRFLEFPGIDQTVYLVRPEVRPLVAERHPKARVEAWGTPGPDPVTSEADWLFVNARLLALGKTADYLAQLPAGSALFVENELVAMRLEARAAPGAFTGLAQTLTNAGVAPDCRAELQRHAIQNKDTPEEFWQQGARLVRHTWELPQYNVVALLDDFEKQRPRFDDVLEEIPNGVYLVNARDIRIEASVRLLPGSVLDASDGPICIDRNVEIQPNSTIRGPVYVGEGSVLKAGAKIHEATSIGPVCKVGGEVEGSIIQGFSNKQHEGFLGHAYLGEWVNLGADTNNSDLKNNYSNVRAWEDGDFVDTRSMFVGLIAADHVKSAINTQFNTGTVVGVASQVFGPGFPPKYIPPFSWGGAEGLQGYRYDRALETARIVMKRRQQELTPAYESAFRQAFEQR